jgi:hypothetical protein
MSDAAKFKLNLKTREVEIEGSEEFVSRQIQNLESIFNFLNAEPEDEADFQDRTGEKVQSGEVGGKTDDTSNGRLPATFGEFMHSFDTDRNDLEKALITARFVQSQSSTNDFKTSEINNALKDHGIKLSNPSVSLKRLAEKKFLFQTRKVGKLRYMRVSVEGQAFLDTIKTKSAS